jgi:hypothetical protein
LPILSLSGRRYAGGRRSNPVSRFEPR